MNKLMQFGCASAAILLSSAALAGGGAVAPSTCHSGFSVGVTGMYLNTSKNFVYYTQKLGTSKSDRSNLWAYGLDMAYHMCSGLYFKASAFQADPKAKLSDKTMGIEYNNKNKHQFVDLVAGAQWSPINALTVDLFGGAGFMNEKAHVKDVTGGGGPAPQGGDLNHKFDGWGPVFGVNAQMHLSDSFSIVAGVQNNYYFGENSGKGYVYDYDNTTRTPTRANVNFNYRMTRHVISGFAGVRWNAMDALSIDLGYKSYHFDKDSALALLATEGHLFTDPSFSGIYARLGYSF